MCEDIGEVKLFQESVWTEYTDITHISLSGLL